VRVATISFDPSKFEISMLEASNTDHAQRFANKSAEASLSYANAGAFAGMFAFNTLFEAWADACTDAMSPNTTSSKSWFRNPEKVDLYDPWAFWTKTGGTAADPWVRDLWSGQYNWMAQAWSPIWWTSTASPFTAVWSEFFPKPSTAGTDLSFTRSPFWDTATAALPMTWSLMSFGMPHAVAKPTAEANTAALEAFDSAQQVASDQMAAYTSAFDSASNAAASDQDANLFETFSLLFWPWLTEAPAANTSKAA